MGGWRLQETSYHAEVDESIPTLSWTEWKLSRCVELQKAAIRGDWEKAKKLLEEEPRLMVQTPITNRDENLLHIASAAGQKGFVQRLIQRSNRKDLSLRDTEGNTALHLAAASGVVGIARAMVIKYPELPMHGGKREEVPLHVAARFGLKTMVRYLYEVTSLENLTGQERAELFHAIIQADIYDVALKMWRKDAGLATSEDRDGRTALQLMAQKNALTTGNGFPGFINRWLLSWFERWFTPGNFMQPPAERLVSLLWSTVLEVKRDEEILQFVREKKLLFEAAKSGNADFLIVILRAYPNLVWEVDEDNQSIFHISVIQREEKVFSLIYELGAAKKFITELKHRRTGDTMLHQVANFLWNQQREIRASDPFLVMQRELIWFEAVKEIAPISHMQDRNTNGQLPQVLFKESHKAVQENDEKWLKGEVKSSMIVASLIATVAFAAGITFPGGNKDTNGMPRLEGQWLFKIFIPSTAVAMSSASIALGIFLWLLTACYGQRDFLISVPLNLLLGVLANFVSLVAMTTAFMTAVLLTHKREKPFTMFIYISLGSFIVLSYIGTHSWFWIDTLVAATMKAQFLLRSYGSRRKLFI